MKCVIAMAEYGCFVIEYEAMMVAGRRVACNRARVGPILGNTIYCYNLGYLNHFEFTNGIENFLILLIRGGNSGWVRVAGRVVRLEGQKAPT